MIWITTTMSNVKFLIDLIDTKKEDLVDLSKLIPQEINNLEFHPKSRNKITFLFENKIKTIVFPCLDAYVPKISEDNQNITIENIGRPIVLTTNLLKLISLDGILNILKNFYTNKKPKNIIISCISLIEFREKKEEKKTEFIWISIFVFLYIFFYFYFFYYY